VDLAHALQTAPSARTHRLRARMDAEKMKAYRRERVATLKEQLEA
jgi:hypothetical protein